MIFNCFSIFIYLLTITLIGFIIKVYKNTHIIKEKGSQKHMLLEKQYVLEKSKSGMNTEQLKLVDNLHQSLFNRLFIITKEILLLQKLIFDKQS